MPESRKRQAGLARTKLDPKLLDDGIRDCVLLLRNAGFTTFTSCEGGKGHSFRHGTINLTLEESYSSFQRKLVAFLRSQGMQNFTVSLVTDYTAEHPEGKSCVYVEGLDLLSEGKRGKVIEAAKRKARLAVRQLRELGNE